jgi:hypothetical protein
MLRPPSCKRKLSKAMALLPFLAWASISLIPALLYTSSCSTAASVAVASTIILRKKTGCGA